MVGDLDIVSSCSSLADLVALEEVQILIDPVYFDHVGFDWSSPAAQVLQQTSIIIIC